MNSLFLLLQHIFESPFVFKFFAALNAWDKQHSHFILYLVFPLFLFTGLGYLIWSNIRNKPNED